MINIFQENLIKSAKKYGNLILLNNGNMMGCMDFPRFYRDRCVNLGLGKQNIASVSVGFFVGGKLPIILCDTDFVVKAYSQILEGICIPNLSIKIVGIGGCDLNDIEFVKQFPNLTVYIPKNEEELAEDVKKMVDLYGPVYLRIIV